MEMKDLNELAEKVQKPKGAADMIKQYEENLSRKRKVLYPWRIIRGKVLNASKKRKSLYRW